MGTNQTQKAGEGSQLVQIGNVINVGITEKRAREIFSEMNEIARKNYTQDAYEIAIKRVSILEELLMNKVQQIEGMLEAFKDPSFQFLLTEAQKRAAASDRENDFEMLVELLVHRVEKKNNRKIKASISKAIEVVDQIDDDALCGLTLIYAINCWFAKSGDISHGLATMNDLFSTLCYRELPSGFDWADHLDILNAVRSSHLGIVKTFKEYYTNEFTGYTCVGIQKDSENYLKALEILKKVNLPLDMLISHELNEGYMRLTTRNKSAIMDLKLNITNENQVVSTRNVTTEEIEALNQVWNLYSTDYHLKEKVNNAFMQKWDTFDALRTVRLWWEALPHGIAITPIGIVLAHANVRKFYKNIPDVNF